jgi:hypothetical protein
MVLLIVAKYKAKYKWHGVGYLVKGMKLMTLIQIWVSAVSYQFRSSCLGTNYGARVILEGSVMCKDVI